MRVGATFLAVLGVVSLAFTHALEAQSKRKRKKPQEVVVPTKSGTHELKLRSSEKEREYVLHIPRGYKKKQKKRLPMVFMLHGRSGSGRQATTSYYGWKQLADREKFIAVFPTALGSPTSWKGAWRGTPTEDSKFLAQLIDLLSKELRVDTDRVFMTGHSSGGYMSYSFAVTHSQKVAAIAPVAGLLVGRARLETPVSVIAFHGMDDDVVPYESKRRRGHGAVASAAAFAEANGCAKVVRTDIAKGNVHVDTWANGEKGTEVVLYSIEGGGHGWPQKGARSVATTQRIWEFFVAHPRGGDKRRKSRRHK